MRIIGLGILLFAAIPISSTFGPVNVQRSVAGEVGVRGQTAGLHPQYYVTRSVVSEDGRRQAPIVSRKSEVPVNIHYTGRSAIEPECGTSCDTIYEITIADPEDDELHPAGFSPLTSDIALAPKYTPAGHLGSVPTNTEGQRVVVHPARAGIPGQSEAYDPQGVDYYRGKTYGGYCVNCGDRNPDSFVSAIPQSSNYVPPTSLASPGQYQNPPIGFQTPDAARQSPGGPILTPNSLGRGAPTPPRGDTRFNSGHAPITNPLHNLDVEAMVPYLSFEEQEKIYNEAAKGTPAAPADPVSLSLAYRKFLQSYLPGSSDQTSTAESSLAFGPKTIPADGRKRNIKKDFPEEKLHIVERTILQPPGDSPGKAYLDCSFSDDEEFEQAPASVSGQLESHPFSYRSMNEPDVYITYRDLGYEPIGSRYAKSEHAPQETATDNSANALYKNCGPPLSDFQPGGVTFERVKDPNAKRVSSSVSGRNNDLYHRSSYYPENNGGHFAESSADSRQTCPCQSETKSGKFKDEQLRRLWHAMHDRCNSS